MIGLESAKSGGKPRGGLAGGRKKWHQYPRLTILFFGLFPMLAASGAALAQKQGGILRQYIIDSPASMSIHEETTVVAERPMMAVMNNLVLFDQHVAQNSLDAIRPELATDWAWDEDGTKLSFHLRQGVKWHDG
jgi:peptide/nickel transport system substrate-binding protein